MKSMLKKYKFSNLQLVFFALVFAAIGGYIILRSFASPNPNLPGDLNNDNIVNVSDLSILLGAYGTTNTNADINLDGQVTVLDLSVLLSHYGSSYSGGGAVSGASTAICSPSPCTAGTVPNGTVNHITLNNINNGSVNQTRTYGYYKPNNLLNDGSAQGKPAAVFDLGRQGCDGNGESKEYQVSQIGPVADANHFVVIELVCTSTGSSSWLHPQTDCGGAGGVSGGGSCSSSSTPSDNPYIAAVVADATSRFHIDPARRYLVGGSSGANMTRDAICSTSTNPHNSTFFRGAMTMGGGANAKYNTTSGVCPNGDKNVFWLEVMGKASQSDPYNTLNTPANCTTNCDHTVLGFDATRNWWSSYLGSCGAPVHTSTGSGVLSDIYSYNGCNNNVTATSPFFEAAAVTNGGHMWCGLDATNNANCGAGCPCTNNTGGWSTASYMWNFFANTVTSG